ncbi:hypothetical protein [Thermus antranikianii]|uniref:hypothetical protein n=1 Tax=Thermus antranikianii TaxID=88190 RepID=UPI001C791D7B|nr:hypothetical protein [Thermus antranikianii]QWK21466.1 MAG: hypothetical protein KNN15_10615 [Thermus antranikianii]
MRLIALLPLLGLLSLAWAKAPLDKGVVIADAGNHRLVELAGEGRLVRLINLLRPFRYTDDVFVAPGGSVAYITDPEVDAVGYPAGRLLWLYGRPGHPGAG